MRPFSAALAASGTIGAMAGALVGLGPAVVAHAATRTAETAAQVAIEVFERGPPWRAPHQETVLVGTDPDPPRHVVEVDVAALMASFSLPPPSALGPGQAAITMVLPPAPGRRVDLGLAGIASATFLQGAMVEVFGDVSAEQLAALPLVVAVLE